MSLIIGIINGFGQMARVRRNPDVGYKPSKNIFAFLFTDPY
jgi:hypothetical protein